MPKACYLKGMVVPVSENREVRVGINCMKERSSENKCTVNENPNRANQGRTYPSEQEWRYLVCNTKDLALHSLIPRRAIGRSTTTANTPKPNFVKYLG